MKTKTKKILCAVPVAVLVLLCGCLLWMTLGAEKGDDVPVMATPDTTETTEPTQTLPPETEPETQPEVVDLSSKGLLFESRSDGTCVVSGAGTCRDSIIVLPEKSPEGETVTGVGNYAFRGCTFLRGIELTDAIRSIGSYAFYGSGLEAVNLPAATITVGDYAFGGCLSLKSIYVSAENPNYIDQSGVMTDKAGQVILCYPAGRNENFYTLPANVREIRTMAFYKCDSIKLINYCGSASSFRRILIGAGNEVIESAVITYSTSTDLFTDGRETSEK